MKTDVIIQARLASTRFPKKILKDLPYNSNLTILDQVIRRVSQSKKIDDIIIATTNESGNEAIIEIARKNNVEYYIGSEHNVLQRYYEAAEKFGTELIVRVTSDSPCIDWSIFDKMIEIYGNTPDLDYISNTLTNTYPHGFDTEVFSFNSLAKAHTEATEHFEREHVTPYIYKSGNFNIKSLEAPTELHHPEIRITVDTLEDYTLVCTLYDYLYEDNNFFNSYDIFELFENKPWLKNINRKIVQKKVNFTTIEEEIEEAIKVLQLQDLPKVAELLDSMKQNI